jgi:transcriptional antiterminator NusG
LGFQVGEGEFVSMTQDTGFHPMQDEHHRAPEEVTSHESSFVADDAVTNRSDDTALEDSDVERRGPGDASSEDYSIDDSRRFGDEQAASTDDRGDEAKSSSNEESAPTEAMGETSADAVVADVADEQFADESEAGEEDPADERAAARRRPVEEAPQEEEEIRMDWYILKVQSNRERSIAEALERKIKIEGLDRYFDQVIVPTEKVTEFKGGKKKVVERKLYPGYIVVHMHINDDTWFAVRETSGVGDFTGAGGKPTPMLQHEVARIIQTEEEETSEAPKLDIKFSSGDKVKVKEGNFENFEGEVNTIDEASGRVTVMINIFGRSTPVELEYWQIEAV